MLRSFTKIVARSTYFKPNLVRTSWRWLTSIANEQTYHAVADKALEELYDGLSDLDSKCKDADINLAQGVLTINLGQEFGNKTWVINKQTPNRQIWWSSPISGPRRYEYGERQGVPKVSSSAWYFSKDSKSNLWEQLKQEIKTVTGIDINHDA